MMDARLRVWLKGVDLVASTAFLTLTDKMGYAGALRALCRFDDFEWQVGTDDPAAGADRLRRILSVQSAYYNRNKHNYLLDCRWTDGRLQDGVLFSELEARLAREATLKADDSQEFDSKNAPVRGILKNVPMYRTCVRVEDAEHAHRNAMAAKLSVDLGVRVVPAAMGTSWLLALTAPSEAEAESLTRGIVESRRRDQGLLANPNYQAYRILSLDPIEPT